jgi:hypothetical protein
MPIGVLNILARERVDELARDILAEDTPSELRFYNRYPSQPTAPGQIMARYEGRGGVMADIITDDARAVVGMGRRIELSTEAVPNIKRGAHFTQEMIALLDSIGQRGGATRGEVETLTAYMQDEQREKIREIQRTVNFLLARCLVEQLSYQRLNVTISNVSWGMPADLRLTPAVEWTVANAATATPVTDIREFLIYARDTYSETYNRLTMGSGVWTAIKASDEFRDQALLLPRLLTAGLTAGDIPRVSESYQLQLFVEMLGGGIQIEIEDYAGAWVTNDGSRITERALPVNLVLLSNTADDGDPAVIRFAQDVVTETLISTLGAGSAVVGGGFPSRQFGPVSYVTAPPDLNPPNATLWAVERGFPSKRRSTATAVIEAYAA